MDDDIDNLKTLHTPDTTPDIPENLANWDDLKSLRNAFVQQDREFLKGLTQEDSE